MLSTRTRRRLSRLLLSLFVIMPGGFAMAGSIEEPEYTLVDKFGPVATAGRRLDQVTVEDSDMTIRDDLVGYRTTGTGTVSTQKWRQHKFDCLFAAIADLEHIRQSAPRIDLVSFQPAPHFFAGFGERVLLQGFQ